MHDAIVVGGGPVGSQVAYNLSGAGYDVAVLEKKSDLGGPVCCTGIISQECFDSFNLADSIVIRNLCGARLFAPGGHSLRVWRPETQAYLINRGGLDSFLAHRAQNAGAKYILDCTVEHVDTGYDSVSLVSSLQGKKAVFSSRCVVDASGFIAGQSRETRSSHVSDFTMGVQAEVVVNRVDEVEVYLGRRYAPGFFAWIVPTFHDKALVGLMSRQGAMTYLKSLLEELTLQGKIKSVVGQPGVRPIPLKPISRTISRRLLISGGAAGQVKPLTGGGLYYGLICADIAAETLKQALADGDFSAQNLSGYSREWHRRLGHEIRTSYMLRKLFEHLNDRQMDRIFEVAKSSGLVDSYMKMPDVTFDGHAAIAKKLLREKALQGIWEVIKRPFALGTNNN